MAWLKVPDEHFPLFHASLPKDKRVRTVNLFGAVAGLVNGNMFSGLFERSAIVKLSPADHEEALKLDGAAPFDPMGTGRGMSRTIVLPESIMDEPAELRAWFQRAFDHVATLPEKVKKPRGAKAKKPAAKKPVAKKPAAKKTVAKASAKKPAVKAKRGTTRR